MLREGNVLLAEEPRVTDATVYFSVLAAISQGATRRGEIASAVGKAEGAVAHPLVVLPEAGLIAPLSDALKQKRTTFHIAEPVMRLHQLVIVEARLVRHHADAVWAEVADTVSARVYGPHFEHLARTWCTEYATTATLGGTPSVVAPAAIACREHRTNHEIDAVVLESAAQGPDRITALDAAKWRSVPNDTAQLERLGHLRDLLEADEAKLLASRDQGSATGCGSRTK